MPLTIADRVAAFKLAYPKWPASWPYLVTEQGRDVLYATWLIGQDYRNKTSYFGAYPKGYLERVSALFPPAPRTLRQREDASTTTLHAFSGSLPAGPYVRLDINPDCGAEIVGSVYDIGKLCLGRRLFRLVLADPPYSAAHSLQYKTPMIDRRRATAALASVTKSGGHMVWLRSSLADAPERSVGDCGENHDPAKHEPHCSDGYSV